MPVVPRLSEPARMPEGVRVIIEIIGNATRTELLRLLTARPRTMLELAAEIDVAHSSIHRHLALLEQHGLVSTDTAPGRRQGRTVVWSANPERITEIGQRWISYATAIDPSPEGDCQSDLETRAGED